MGNTQQQGSGAKAEGLKEAVIVIGILMAAVGGAAGTYWLGIDREPASTGKSEAEAAGATTVAAKTSEPAPAAPVAATAAEMNVQHADVYFDFKRTRLRADAVAVLQDKAGIIKKGGSWVVLVQGYADRQGPAEYNKALAQRRATMVKEFLAELGVPETSLKVVTIGPEAALCDDPSPECRQLNRRVHLEIRKLTLPTAAASASPVVTDQSGPDTATRP